MLMKDLSDEQLLDKIIEAADDQYLLHTFTGMRDRVLRGYTLSPRQREWVEDEFSRKHLEADLPAENLISSGQYVPTPEERAKRYTFEDMPRPLRPPGR